MLAEGPHLSHPLEQMVMTSPFGPRVRNGRLENHAGIDLRAQIGAEVFASADGTVIDSRNGDFARAAGLLSYGERIFVVHDGGWVTLCAHLASRLVESGDRVQRGQRIGFSGNTGDASDPHLHFELRLDSRSVDPLPFLALFP